MSTAPRPDRRVATVPVHGDGQRLDRFLVEHFPRYSRRRLAEVVRRGAVRVNGRRARPGTRLAAGDRLELPVLSEAVEAVGRATKRRERLRAAVAAPTDVVVLHRDDDLLVVAKPPGLPVHGGRGVPPGGSLVDVLREDVLAGFGLVHRLDRDTSGVLALVRGEALRAETAARFAAGGDEIAKVYEALVEGVPDPATGDVRLPLRPPGHRGRTEVDEAAGRPAWTRYETLEAFHGVARLRVRIFTGRTHQIRAHLAAIGHPLLVDPLYGNRGGWRLADPRGRLDARLRRTPLHASELTLPHPRTNEPVTVRAPLPPDMHYALEVLRVDAGRRRRKG
jgi:RluA family pseudouridine synthase